MTLKDKSRTAKVGDKFEHGGITYEVLKANKRYRCEKNHGRIYCAFFTLRCHVMVDCNKESRPDKTNVLFKQVKQVKQ